MDDLKFSPKYPSPPFWDSVNNWEQNLPQHNLSLSYPEGRSGRYVKFSNQNQRNGWNNILHELLLNAHLAYESKRAYVFQPFLWRAAHYPWPWYQMRNRPPRTPLSAIISGPTAGGSWEEGSDAPRSVREDWFDVVCPPSERRIINTGELKHDVYWSEGIVIFNHWKKFLLEAPERCIEVVPEDRKLDGNPEIFDMWLLGGPRMISLWDSFSNSSTARMLDASPVVKSAVERNEYFFFPRGPRLDFVSPNRYDRILATHVRRGDFKKACIDRANWKSTFYSWNLIPELPDRYEDPPGGELGKNIPENVKEYLKHCLPTMDEIVQKVRDSRDDFYQMGATTLDVIYLMTEEKGEWLDEIKSRLKEDGWHTVVSTRDLLLDDQQTEVGMAVDMEIARRAAVFVGNGWSSLTSSIVFKRLVDGREHASCRFF